MNVLKSRKKSLQNAVKQFALDKVTENVTKIDDN